MGVGLVGPEFMLHLAWIQFFLARWVMLEMQKSEKRSVETILSYIIKLYSLSYVWRSISLPCLYYTNIFIWLRRSQTDVEI